MKYEIRRVWCFGWSWYVLQHVAPDVGSFWVATFLDREDAEKWVKERTRLP